MLMSLLCVFVAIFQAAMGAPIPSKRASRPAENLVKRGKASAPYFVVYGNAYPGPAPPVSALSGYNVFALSFLQSDGPRDKALEWMNLPESERARIKAEYNAAGISLVVSLFGAVDHPTSKDPIEVGNIAAQYVKTYGLDGVDVDYEDIDAMNAGTGADWVIALTKTLRAQLPQGQYILSHAPLAPWFSPGRFGGGYLKVNEAVGSSIDFYSIQFYNQGADAYNTCAGLLTSSIFPQTSLFQIPIPLNKLVIGKPATLGDSTNGGLMDAVTLAGCVAEAKAKGWNGGVMFWQYPSATSELVNTVGKALKAGPPPAKRARIRKDHH